jgi:hypothetical protein
MLVADYASIDRNVTPRFSDFYEWGGRAVLVRGAFTFKGQAFGDPCVARDRGAIYATDLTFGSYLIHGWTVDPLVQVAKFKETVGPYRPGDLPVWLDAESDKPLAQYGLTAKQALARLEMTYAALADTYPVVGVYDSLRWWHEMLFDIDSPTLGRRCPLWIKIPYPWKSGNSPHLEARGDLGELPAPWKDPNGPGAWCKQFQGDAVNVPGFSSTVDLSEWIPHTGTPWIAAQLQRHAIMPVGSDFDTAIRTFQTASGLYADGIIGPKTFAALCQ